MQPEQAFLYKTNPAQGLVYVEMDARCAQPGLFFGRGPFQFLQAPGKVVILSEYQHHTRTIYLDGRPHLGKDFKLFMGDSVGHWEGSTLVVDTTNFNGRDFLLARDPLSYDRFADGRTLYAYGCEHD